MRVTANELWFPPKARGGKYHQVKCSTSAHGYVLVKERDYFAG